MSNYISGGQKKIKIFKKRERELIHAINHGYDGDKIFKAAERLRDSKLQAITFQTTTNKAIAEKWSSFSNELIVTMYSKKGIKFNGAE
jgi:hypothetical protein